MKRIATGVGLLLGCAGLLLFAKSAATHWAALQELALGPEVFKFLPLAVLLYLVTYATSAASWKYALRLVDVNLGYKPALEIVTLSQIAKYVPGNVGQHLGRVVLAQEKGIAAGCAIASLALEAMLLIAAAVLCSAAALDILRAGSDLHGAAMQRNLLLFAAAAAVGVGLLLLIPRTRRHVRTLAVKGVQLFVVRNIGTSVRILACHVASFMLGAIALWLVIYALVPQPAPFSSTLIGIYAIAWLIGFLVPGAPAGIGVREALLLLGVGSLFGVEIATATALLFRVCTVLGDGLAFGMGTILRRTRSAGPPNET